MYNETGDLVNNTVRAQNMQFTRIGEFLAASRITGPTHNLLQIKLGEGMQENPICEALPPIGNCSHKALNESELVEAVLKGVEEANKTHGTKYTITHIKYVKNDTKPEAVYEYLSLKIIEHLENGGEFVQGGVNQVRSNKRVKIAPFGRWDAQKARALYPHR